MTDILSNENGSLAFKDGDFATGFSENQHQHDILLANKGEYKEFPEIGVGLIQMLQDDEYTDVLIEAKKNLQYDGMEIDNITIDEYGKLNIYGKYSQ
ncbi:oxidase [Flavobacterium sp. DG1-102-2]|uniref:oxidase n=1 Tax=Flavobacterium sp. DG1-102-2 TaxID=3081663 RepID=UPI00294A1B32|nr:oxidase [Flavobacterium sp. DG1-102-2]MDV6170226.1 oxidase [Flavobacterium sp. DG1-102-2]